MKKRQEKLQNEMPGLSTCDVEGVAERKKKRICVRLVVVMGCALNVGDKFARDPNNWIKGLDQKTKGTGKRWR